MITLLKAFRDLPQYHLKVAGIGPKEDELKMFVKENDMHNVKFLGYKTGEELMNLVNNAYFVVVPSEWYENNPMTIIEAYSVGTPVIGAYIGGIPEIVIDGYTGFRFKSGNADDLHNTLLKAVALDDKAYMKLSRGTINFANDNLSKESYWTKLIAFYDQFVAIT